MGGTPMPLVATDNAIIIDHNMTSDELTTSEAARISGCALRTIQNYVKSRRLKAIKRGRDYFIRHSDLQALLDNPPHKGRPKKKVEK